LTKKTSIGTFKLSKEEAKKQWNIDLGDVRESARVYINGRYMAMK
jgi:hypothetical protein